MRQANVMKREELTPLVEAPSMMPMESKASKKEDIPLLADLVKSVPMRLEILNLVGKSYSLGKQLGDLKKLRDPITDRLKTLVGKLGLTKVRVGSHTLSYYSYDTKVVDPLKLLALGVHQETIDKAMVSTTTYTLRITYSESERLKAEDKRESSD